MSKYCTNVSTKRVTIVHHSAKNEVQIYVQVSTTRVIFTHHASKTVAGLDINVQAPKVVISARKVINLHLTYKPWEDIIVQVLYNC